mgnify:CR=1 FL=1
MQHTGSIFFALRSFVSSGSGIGHATGAAYLNSWMYIHEAGSVFLAPEALLTTGLLLHGARSVFVLYKSKKLRAVNESSY